MRRLVLLLVALSMAVQYATPYADASIRVTAVIDGDTIKLASGKSVRLLQIDTPELRENECFAKEAQKTLAALLARKGELTLKKDPGIEGVDSYGRLLRYAFKGKKNLNIEMVRLGAAAPWFYRGTKGRYAEKLLQAAKSARKNGTGLWSACPGTILDPYRALSTNKTLPSNSASGCDPNYEGCVPVYPPDLDCSDIKAIGLAPVRIIGTDVHKLDGDGDNIGCN